MRADIPRAVGAAPSSIRTNRSATSRISSDASWSRFKCHASSFSTSPRFSRVRTIKPATSPNCHPAVGVGSTRRTVAIRLLLLDALCDAVLQLRNMARCQLLPPVQCGRCLCLSRRAIHPPRAYSVAVRREVSQDVPPYSLILRRTLPVLFICCHDRIYPYLPAPIGALHGVIAFSVRWVICLKEDLVYPRTSDPSNLPKLIECAPCLPRPRECYSRVMRPRRPRPMTCHPGLGEVFNRSLLFCLRVRFLDWIHCLLLLELSGAQGSPL